MPKPDNSCCRSEDIVCRFGGEEFVVFLPNTSVVTAEVLRSVLGVLLKVLFSLITCGSPSLLVWQHKRILLVGSILLKNADDALYQAKGEGRNKVIVYSAI
uniref:GGDEF domain-containing protein n=1 Tax=Salmonella sp. TaxID=599 RepID=UPI002DDA09A9|nr:diguanylate cyclase [Salmonella sp.]